MKRAIIFTLFFALALAGFCQTESHDFITYDSAIYLKVNTWDSARYSFRVSRPRVSDGIRPAIIMIPGKGEQGKGNLTPSYPAGLQAYGPHFWLNNGWDGGIQLGNGKHYPILITIQYRDPNVTIPWEGFKTVLLTLIKTYSINPKAVHLTGLSYGSWVSSGLAAYMAPGSITSIAPLSGAQASMGTYAPLGHWAKLGGKAFFTVGYQDNGNNIEPPKAVKAMQDSAAGSVFYTYNNVGGGLHTGWNDIYNPANNQWWSGKFTTTKVYQGTYRDGWNIYQWMLRQGDTSLVGAPPPVIIPANKYPIPVIAMVNPITAPTAWVILDGTASYDPDGTIDSVAFSQVSGPSTATIIYNSCGLTAGVVGLIPGTYIFKLQVWDNKLASTLQLVSVIVNPVPVTTVVSIPLSFTILGAVINKTIIVKSDGSYTIQ